MDNDAHTNIEAAMYGSESAHKRPNNTETHQS